jgi:hypothetical protein
MPYTEVMDKFKKGKLHSGSKSGPPVKNKKQALAIMLSEKKEADKGKKEYKPKLNTGPTRNFMKKFKGGD